MAKDLLYLCLIGQNWPELARIDQNWPELARIGQNWPELARSVVWAGHEACGQTELPLHLAQ